VPTVHFTANLQRHVRAPSTTVEAKTVGEALEQVFQRIPGLRGYVLDDQGGVRHHVGVFVAGQQIRDRQRLTDAVGADDEIWVMQALSGG
jgi:sulfur-carrier protein